MNNNDACARWFRQATGHEPYPFQIPFADGDWLRYAARFVCLETLIRMKAATGRERDQEDVRTLRQLEEKTDGDS